MPSIALSRGCCVTSEAKALCMGCSWIGFQAVYGSQQLYLLTKWPHPMAAIAVRLGILEETHKI